MARSENQRPTLREVAEQAGVSLMTVSYTFNNPARVSAETRARVADAAARVGYQGKNPWATSLRSGRSGALGVVFSEHLTYAFSDPQAAGFLEGVASVCAEQGLGLTFIPTLGDERDAERISSAAVDGYVFWTTEEGDPALDAAAETHRPCSIQGGPSHEGFTTVAPDDRLAAAAISAAGMDSTVRSPVIVSFSLNGHRSARSGYGLPIEEALLPVTRDRLLGFRDTLLGAGIPWEAVYTVSLSRNVRSEAAAAIAELFDVGRIPIDAALCMSDELALGVLNSARMVGRRIPEDLVVTGWDDGPSADSEGLTSLRQSLYDQGRSCGLIAAGLPHDLGDVPWSVVPRGSTRARSTEKATRSRDLLTDVRCSTAPPST